MVPDPDSQNEVIFMPPPPNQQELARPYLETCGPMASLILQGKCPGYHLEIDSHCNVRCALCFPGNKEGYVKTHGRMSLELVERILDKIVQENPAALVLPFGNSEPFLHPQLPEIIAAVKRRGLAFRLSSNMNYVNRMEEVVAQQPDLFVIGVSGWTQGMYGKTHQGGDIERVKRNMYDLGQLRQKYGTRVLVSYHLYRDNMGPEEQGEMATFCRNLGFEFMPAPARGISMENMLSYLRYREKQRTGTVPDMPIGKDGLDWNKLLPPPNQNYLDHVGRLWVSPEQAQEMYARWPVPNTCPISHLGCYIRWDGKVTLCCIMEDRRLDLGSYLEMTQDQICAARQGHPLCHECLRYKLNLYCCLVEQDRWIGYPHV